jgi:ParB family transcriptional regulator, chromosome partitioning protein
MSVAKIKTRSTASRHDVPKSERVAPVASSRVGTIWNVPMVQISVDPEQPRKLFEPKALSELAASIRANGLLQPITLRRLGPDAYMVIAGERRFRAFQVNGSETIPAIVHDTTDRADIRVKQIIENDQRQDVSPLEQGRSYQELMAEQGWSAQELSERIGKPVWRILERTSLLTLCPEYQALLASGNLKPSEAQEMARLQPRAQAILFAAIRAGRCASYNDLRSAANALVQVEAQFDMMPDAPPPATPEERKLAGGFEAKVEQVAALLRHSISDNEIVATKKVNPHRAGHLADLLGAMQKDIRRIELALREAAIQASFLAV